MCDVSQYHQQSDECDVLKVTWLHGAHDVIMSTHISLRPKASRGQLFELLVDSETRRCVDKPPVTSESQRTEQDFEAVEHIMIHYDEKTWAPLSLTGGEIVQFLKSLSQRLVAHDRSTAEKLGTPCGTNSLVTLQSAQTLALRHMTFESATIHKLHPDLGTQLTSMFTAHIPSAGVRHQVLKSLSGTVKIFKPHLHRITQSYSHSTNSHRIFCLLETIEGTMMNLTQTLSLKSWH